MNATLLNEVAAVELDELSDAARDYLEALVLATAARLLREVDGDVGVLRAYRLLCGRAELVVRRWLRDPLREPPAFMAAVREARRDRRPVVLLEDAAVDAEEVTT